MKYRRDVIWFLSMDKKRFVRLCSRSLVLIIAVDPAREASGFDRLKAQILSQSAINRQLDDYQFHNIEGGIVNLSDYWGNLSSLVWFIQVLSASARLQQSIWPVSFWKQETHWGG